MKRVALVVIGAVAAGALLLSCGGGSSKQASTIGPIASYTGRISNSDAFVAIVAGKQNVVAFVADGAHKTGIRFTGPRLGPGFDIALPFGARLAGVISAKQTAGALQLGTEPPRTFTATPTTGRAGLYGAVTNLGGSQVGLAWVVLNDGQQRGVQIANGAVSDAPQLDSTSTTISVGGASTPVVRTTPGNTVGVGFGGGFQGGGGQLGQGGGKFGFGG